MKSLWKTNFLWYINIDKFTLTLTSTIPYCPSVDPALSRQQAIALPRKQGASWQLYLVMGRISATSTTAPATGPLRP